MQPDCLKGLVVCGTVYGDMHLQCKRSLGINRKSRVLYPGSGFPSSAALSSLLKKHYMYNGLINNQYEILGSVLQICLV